MKFSLIFLLVLLFTLAGCSSGDESASDKTKPTLTGDHVWKAQTDALKQAQEVGALASEAAEKKRKAIEELDQQ